MSVKPIQTALVQLIEKQVGIRNTNAENIHYQKELSGAFEEDVDKVVQLFIKNQSLVPDLPAWSWLCDNFEKGRCSFGSSCYFAHGRVIQKAIQQFRYLFSIKPRPRHTLALSPAQSQRLLIQVHQAAHQPLPSIASDLTPPASPALTPYHTQPSTPAESPHQTPYLEPLDSPPLTPRSFSLDAERTPYDTQPTTPKASPYQTPDLTPPASPLSTPRSLPKAPETPQIKKPVVFDANNPFDLLGGDPDLESTES